MKFVVVFHLDESNKRAQLGGLGAWAGAHHCILEADSIKAAMDSVAERIGPDCNGIEVWPVSREFE
jgi:hypothetical protein